MVTAPRGRAPASDAGVRPAVARDVQAIAAVHARAWQAAYRDVLPPAVRDALSNAELVAAWDTAVRNPPSTGHRVLVATAADLVTGFAAATPSADPDGADGDVELVALEVDPAHQNSGHGSRLLNAAVDTARDAGAARLLVWVPAVDNPRVAFFTAAGLTADGAERTREDDNGAQWTERRMTASLGATR